ncbi:MAG TPA: alginate export family protein, partial [Bryobacteraceae bacterium]|nr:alginate export family protein [Bryobacteraceae bacterium]
MKLRFALTALFSFLLMPATPGFGQTPAIPQASDSSANKKDQDSSEKNYLLRTLKFSGSIRERWEATDGPFSVTPADSYVVSQIRLGLLFQPVSWLQFFAQAQDVRPLFYRTAPSNAFYDPFDLHQVWIAAGQQEGPGFFVKLGRQEMVLGSGHLIAATDDWWTYTARDFDIANGTYTSKYFKSQLVAGSATFIDPHRFNEHKPGDHIYADYNTFPHVIPGASVEPYLIVRTLDGVKSKDGAVGNMD